MPAKPVEKKSLKVALYQPWIYQTGGMERVILELTGPKSRHQWTIFTNHFSPNTTFPEFANRKVVELKRVPVQRGFLQSLIVASTIARQKIDLLGFDALVVSTGGFGEFITLSNHEIPIVCYCHTPLRAIHDSSARKDEIARRAPTPVHRLAYSTSEASYKMLEKRAWKWFDEVAANSGETKKRIISAGLANKVQVIHPGANVKGIRPSKTFGDYILVPGRISPLKNIELAIESFAEMEKRKKGFRLVIAGAVSEKDRAYHHKLIEMASGMASVEFIMSPTEEELSRLYSGCSCVLFTAINEDWGLVPVEAMAHGKPVVSVNSGGPKESVINGKTGYLCEADPHKISQALERLVGSKRLLRQMSSQCVKQARKFDNSILVSEFDSLVQKAASAKGVN